MLCYRDKTFCSAKCSNEACPIRWTEKLSKAARAWWGAEGAPVAKQDFSKVCKDFIKENEDV